MITLIKLQHLQMRTGIFRPAFDEVERKMGVNKQTKRETKGRFVGKWWAVGGVE